MLSEPLELDHRRWPIQYVPDDGYFGPGPSQPCPCGAARRSRDCHLLPENVWATPIAKPLIVGERTGFSHRKCYANSSNDCSTKVSGEHWVSRNLLAQLTRDGRIDVTGPNWTKRKKPELLIDDFKANILCARHNTALSSLDTMAGHLIRVCENYQQSLIRAGDQSCEFALFDGETVERWLLKLLWGLAAAGVGRDDHGLAVTQIAPRVGEALLAEVLFRGVRWPHEWGMHVSYLKDVAIGRSGAFAINPFLDEGKRLLGIGAEFGSISLRIALASQPEDELGRTTLIRPAGVALLNADHVQKIVAFGWRDRCSIPLELTVAEPGPARIPSL